MVSVITIVKLMVMVMVINGCGHCLVLVTFVAYGDGYDLVMIMAMVMAMNDIINYYMFVINTDSLFYKFVYYSSVINQTFLAQKDRAIAF